MDLNKRNFSRILSQLQDNFITVETTLGNATLQDWANFIDKSRLEINVGIWIMQSSKYDIFKAYSLLNKTIVEIIDITRGIN